MPPKRKSGLEPATQEKVDLSWDESRSYAKSWYWTACLDLRDRIGDKEAAALLIAEGVKRFSEET